METKWMLDKKDNLWMDNANEGKGILCCKSLLTTGGFWNVSDNIFWLHKAQGIWHTEKNWMLIRIQKFFTKFQNKINLEVVQHAQNTYSLRQTF